MADSTIRPARPLRPALHSRLCRPPRGPGRTGPLHPPGTAATAARRRAPLGHAFDPVPARRLDGFATRLLPPLPSRSAPVGSLRCLRPGSRRAFPSWPVFWAHEDVGVSGVPADPFAAGRDARRHSAVPTEDGRGGNVGFLAPGRPVIPRAAAFRRTGGRREPGSTPSAGAYACAALSPSRSAGWRFEQREVDCARFTSPVPS